MAFLGTTVFTSRVKRAMSFSVVIALVGTFLPFSVSPSNATSACYLVVNGELTDGSACSGDVVIQEGITKIGQYNGGHGAFQLSGITSVTIPASVTEIKDGAFYDAVSLRTVNFAPNSQLESIGYGAFFRATSLQSIDIPSSVRVIDDEAFQMATSLEFITFAPSAIPLSIGVNAFRTNDDLASISFPSRVVSIGDYAFSEAESLEEISFAPNSQLQTIGEGAFSNAGPLRSVTFAANSQLQTIGDYAFAGGNQITTLTIPNSVETIGVEAFNISGSLVSLTLGNGLRTIGDYAFAGGNQITTLTIPNSVETIGVGAFTSSSSLVSLTLGNGLRTIGDNAFSGTSSLTSLIIPDGVRFIGASAFEEDFRLETLRIPSTVESIGAGAFDGTTALRSFQYCGTAAQRENLNLENAGLGRKEILPCPSDPAPTVDPTTPQTSTQAPTTSAAISPVLTNKSMKLKASFSERSSKLSAKEKKKLLKVVASMGSKVTGGKVVGYVQLDGNMANDKKLSTARARAVAKFLADNGIKVRLVTKGNGALNNKESSRRANITLRYAE